MSYASVSVSFSPVDQTALLSAGDDIFNVRAGSLYGAVFNGGTGTDTLNLIGGGTFDLTTATLSSIEVIRGTSSTDTIVLNARILSGIKTLSGGGGGNFLKLSGSGTYNFAGKSVSGFTRIDATAKGFTGAVFDNKATALLLWAQKSQGDSLTLRGGIFTEEERAQLHRQGVDIVIDDSGRYENSAPILRSLDRDRVYTSGAQAFLDRDFDASVGGLDDRLSSLKVIFDDDWMLPGEILIVENPSLTLPDGLVDGGGILFEGTLIGTVVLLGDGFIEVIFNAEATKSTVEALLHALAYRNLDPDPLVRTVNVSMTLTDEGGRFTQVFVEVLAGNADIQFLDQKTNLLAGTEDDDIFATDSLGLTEGDAIDGGNGTDTLLLIGGSSFDLTQLGSLTGIEDIRGSDSRDWITIHGSQLADIRTIDGGEVGTGGSLGDNANLLSILGTDIDLRGKTFLNFSAIRLMSENAVVTVAD
ncbi:MAG TPA: hypothetical protein VFF61_02500, partial [Microvirga sp.]|nr:hypothetical protein [Microvirga sp.]